MKIFSIVTLGFLAFVATANAGTKANRKPSNVDDCTAAAGKHAESYMHDKMTGDADKGLHHQLYKKFPGKNGYNALVYTYLYQLTNDKGAKKGIIRVTENHKCEYTSIGQYKDEEDMDADDHDAAQGGGSED